MNLGDLVTPKDGPLQGKRFRVAGISDEEAMIVDVDTAKRKVWVPYGELEYVYEAGQCRACGSKGPHKCLASTGPQVGMRVRSRIPILDEGRDLLLPPNQVGTIVSTGEGSVVVQFDEHDNWDGIIHWDGASRGLFFEHCEVLNGGA